MNTELHPQCTAQAVAGWAEIAVRSPVSTGGECRRTRLDCALDALRGAALAPRMRPVGDRPGAGLTRVAIAHGSGLDEGGGPIKLRMETLDQGACPHGAVILGIRERHHRSIERGLRSLAVAERGPPTSASRLLLRHLDGQEGGRRVADAGR
jgi:hypothetical protein